MSSLTVINSDLEESEITREHLAESYCVEKLDSDTSPLTFQTIDKHQGKDKNMAEKLKRANYHTKSFRGGESTFMLIYKNDKCFVPTILQKYVVN